MQKKSFVFSFLQTLLKGAFVILLGMMYWSSLLVEEDLKQVKKTLSEIKKDILARPQGFTKEMPKGEKIAVANPHMDASLPNLLVEDPFYEKVLPGLLGKDFIPSGFRKQATVGKPDNLHPFSGFAETGSWRRGCSLSVAKGRIGFFEQYVPSAAVKVEERKKPEAVEYWVFLREGLFWQPLEQEWFPDSIQLAPHFLKKHPLTAHDFKLNYDVLMNPFISGSTAVQMREQYRDIIDVTVVDDYTFFVRWKTYPVVMPDGTTQMQPKYLAKALVMGFDPFAGFLYLYYPDGKKIVEEDQDPNTYRNNSTFGQTLMEHWAKNIIPSCGPLKFKGKSDRMIRFARNEEYYDPLACLVEGAEVEFKSANENIWQEFKQGSLDAYTLLPDQIMEFNQFLKSPSYLEQEKNGMKIKKLEYVFRAFHYVGWNEARPLFKSKKVRRALTMAIDRKRIINQILNGKGIEITSPFYPYSDSYDSSIQPWPYDPAAARTLLEEEGYADLDGDGIIEKKEGENVLKFEFSLTYYVKNPTTKAIVEYISTALKEIGIKCNLNGVDMADISNIFDDKNFDAYFLAWVLTDPPEELRQLWHSSVAKEKGSPNSIGFINKEVDEIIDALSFEYQKEKRIELYHRFDQIFHEESPYTLLYTPRVTMLYREYLQNVFLPVDRQDLIPGAITSEPEPSIYWIKK